MGGRLSGASSSFTPPSEIASSSSLKLLDVLGSVVTCCSVSSRLGVHEVRSESPGDPLWSGVEILSHQCRLLNKNSFCVFSQQQKSVVIEAVSLQTAEWMKSVFRALIRVKQQLRIDPRRKEASRCKLPLMASTGRAGSVKIDSGRCCCPRR